MTQIVFPQFFPSEKTGSVDSNPRSSLCSRMFWSKLWIRQKFRMWMFAKIMLPPTHPFEYRVFHYFHHPFGGNFPLFLGTPMWIRGDTAIQERSESDYCSGNSDLGGGFKHACYFHPYLGKISNLTNIFQVGWNHQLADVCSEKLGDGWRSTLQIRWRII